MLIDCDTCTVRGQGCDDCVVTVLLGAPPGWRGSDPTVVALTRRPVLEGRREAASGAPQQVVPPEVGRGTTGEVVREEPPVGFAAALVSGPGPVGDTPGGRSARGPGVVVELDDVERRAVRALAEVGLVPPLRHQPPTTREVG